ncbi:MAG: tetratricopeptide repeat-containing sulfotransferase family protein [Phycisphaerales bacterium JB038]
MSQQFTMQQLMQQIQQLLNAGQPEQALKMARDVVKSQPNQPPLRHMLGAVYAAIGRNRQARDTFGQVLEQAPNEVRVMVDYAMTCRHDLLFDEAHQMLDRALSVQPDNPQVLAFKADLFFLDARYDEAADLLQEHVEATPQPHPGLLLSYAKMCAASSRPEEGREALDRCLAVPNLPPPMRADALFRLARLQDRAGEYETALETAGEACALRDAKFDTQVFQGLVDDAIDAWSAEAIDQLPRAADLGTERSVFILGMPRSGTSLVEQILASHPVVYGGGELPDIGLMARKLQGMFAFDPPLLSNLSQLTAVNVTSASQSYLERLQRVNAQAMYVTDKMPMNFLHLGLISRLLPRSRIIHCKRNPVDTCISCYFRNFSGSVPFAYNLEHLGQFHKQYERLMGHWQEVLDLPILDLVYEDLVADVEGQTRRLLDFLDLEWDEGCLKFYESGRPTMTSSADQVRRPVYTSSLNRRGNYDALVGELIAALGE